MPLTYSTATVLVEQVLSQRDGNEVAPGQLLKTHFSLAEDLTTLVDRGPDAEAAADSGLNAVIGRVLFLDWDSIWFAGPAGARQTGGAQIDTWVGDSSLGIWGLDTAGRVFPAASEHNYSLLSAGENGDLDVETTEARQTISLESLVDLILAEQATPATTIASFDQWPWESWYEAAIEEAWDDVESDDSE